MKLPDHLGGHLNKVHTDMSTFLYLKEKYEIKTMVDVGCGPGDMVLYAEKHGVKSMGIDGDFTLKQTWNKYDIDVILHDFNDGSPDLRVFNSGFDLIWSVEFLEHVYEKYLPNILKVFEKSKYMIVTTAPPGHGGVHHVNEQPSSYWIEKFETIGFEVDSKQSKHIREEVSLMKKPFMQRNGLFFKKKGL